MEDEGHEDSFQKEERQRKKALDLETKRIELAEKMLAQNSPALKSINGEQAAKLSNAVEYMNRVRSERDKCLDLTAMLVVEGQMTPPVAVETACRIINLVDAAYMPMLMNAKTALSAVMKELDDGSGPKNNSSPTV